MPQTGLLSVELPNHVAPSAGKLLSAVLAQTSLLRPHGAVVSVRQLPFEEEGGAGFGELFHSDNGDSIYDVPDFVIGHRKAKGLPGSNPFSHQPKRNEDELGHAAALFYKYITSGRTLNMAGVLLHVLRNSDTPGHIFL